MNDIHDLLNIPLKLNVTDMIYYLLILKKLLTKHHNIGPLQVMAKTPPQRDLKIANLLIFLIEKETNHQLGYPNVGDCQFETTYLRSLSKEPFLTTSIFLDKSLQFTNMSRTFHVHSGKLT